jgi:uncharacterized protein DUF6760
VTYATERLWEEVAYVGYYLHWGFAEILDMDHKTRQRVIAEVGAINHRLDDE